MSIVRYAGNRMTGLSSDTKPTSNLITGTTFQETNTDDLYIWDGDSWNAVASNSATETLSNKTLTAPVLNGTLSGTAFLDEDNMASDSATAVASQQSIKAYIASTVSGVSEAFKTITVSGQDNIVADGATDTLTIVAGSGMIITNNASTDTITFTVGTATLATSITATANNSTDETVYPTFVDAATGTQGIETDTGLTYNPSSGILTATQFTGAVSGNASTATALANGRTIGMTGDVVWTSASFDGSGNVTGSAVIQATSVENSMLAGSIADSKLNTITTADKVSGAAVQVDGATDGTSIDIAATDKFLIDDGGTTKYVNASQVKSYIGDAASESFAIAMSVAL